MSEIMEVYVVGVDSLFTKLIDTDGCFFLFQSAAGVLGALRLET